MWEQIGTPSYMSPELWADFSKAYDSSVDMWAIGVCAYMLLSGKRPFHHQDRKEKKRMIQNDPVRFSSAEWDRITPHAKDFCLQLMQKDPKKRLSASQALAHPWIKNMAGVRGGGNTPREEIQQHSDIVANLEEFAKADNMRKVAMEVIAFSTPPAKLDELRDLFVKMDENASGTLSEAEFVKAMVGTYAEEEAKRLFRLIDVNDSKEIEYMEFLGAAMSKRTTSMKPSLMSAFSILDRDGNGIISKEELLAILGDDCTDEEINDMIKQSGGTTGINFEQFKHLMLRDMSSMQRAKAWQSASRITAIAQSRLSSSSMQSPSEKKQ
jgi:calcium-dependent protein kinase